MNTNTLFILELVIFNGVVLVWAAREYLSVRPDKTAKPDAAPRPSSPEDAGHPEG